MKFFPVIIIGVFAGIVGVETAVYNANPKNDPQNHLYRSGINYLTEHHLNPAKFTRNQIIANGAAHDNDTLQFVTNLKRDELESVITRGSDDAPGVRYRGQNE